LINPIVSSFCESSSRKRANVVFILCAATAVGLTAQTLTTLHSFDTTDGANPLAGLVQATNGNLYGTTHYGGADGYGTVFQIAPGGTLTTLYSFCSKSACADGSEPFAGLIQATTGPDFYGTTSSGGANGNYGTVFKMTPTGSLATIYSFCSQSGCTDGERPIAGLIQSNGAFYGTTYQGGANGWGTFFKITGNGTLTTLYSFCSQGGDACTDGAYPSGGLAMANGDFYGTTSAGGANAAGTVFKITPGGTLTTLYSFCSQSDCTDGESPVAGLVKASNGDFYGTTLAGGAKNVGTAFKITSTGTLTTIHSFCSKANCTDGQNPAYATLVIGSDGNFYGTTYMGGKGDGTLFKMTGGGTLTTLYSFCSKSGCSDGQTPYGGLVQDTNGEFYGATYGGGANNDGSIFSLSTGLGPFVAMKPALGKVGAPVTILGTALTGASSVSFNGTAAVFEVVSSSEITTTVPTGANSGKIQVITPGGTLVSNASFTVQQ
jgi:uncharacterized repeat protein (TIGR03803 family)